MKIHAEAEVLRIYVGESDQWEGRLLHEAIVDEARARGLAGATVLRGLMGFGAGSVVHTAKILRLSEDLPMVVEIVDKAERIRAFLPHLEGMIGEGVLTRQAVDAVFFCPMRVREVMTAEVVSVAPEAPLSQVLDLLLARGIKAVPVVAGRKVLGMITGGDLLTRAGLSLRLSLHGELPPDMRGEAVERLEVAGRTARDIMSAPVVTVNVRERVPEAAAIMAAKGLKRLPVLDDEGELCGILSRIDILQTIATAAAVAEGGAGTLPPQLPQGLHLTAGDVMQKDVPSIGPERPLAEALDLLVATPLRRVVVVDEARRVLGIVLDRELVRRYSQHEKPGLLRELARLLTPGREADPAFGGTVREAMREDVFSVREDAPLTAVLRAMLETGGKRLVVLDADGRLRGMVDRDRVLKVIGGV